MYALSLNQPPFLVAHPPSPPNRVVSCLQEPAAHRRAAVQSVLGIDDAEAANLTAIVDAGQFKLVQEAEDSNAAFF
jgi:hypothetical protein